MHGDSSPYGPGSRRAAMEQLARPEVRATILQEAGERPEPAGWPPTQWCDLYPMGPGFDYEPGPDQSIASIAAARGESELAVLYDSLTAEDLHHREVGGRGMLGR